MSLKRVNAVVVGAGAGGGIVAKELACAGFSVVLLERGAWYTAYNCRKDDLRNQRSFYLGCAFGPDERSPRVLVDAAGHESIVYSTSWEYSNNAACVGGGTLSYGAMAWRYMEKDFRMRSTYGAVEGSTLEDWPIAYQDLEPYYEKAEWEIGVSGDDSGNPFKAPRKKPLPMPPLAPSTEHKVLESAAKRLGLHPFHIPMLRNTVPYNGRGGCQRCRWCVGFACEVDAKCGTQNTVIPTALATGNCELRTHSIVKEILTDDRGRATGVAYFDENNHLQEQHADLVVVSGAAVESARLLLNSRSRLFPNGLGNRYDWVGRNLQGHAYTGAMGLMEDEVYDDLGPGASIAVCDYNHGNPGVVGGALLCNEFIRLPIHFTTMTPPDVPRWGAAHKEYMRKYYKRSMIVQGPVQELPVFDARVQVDPKVKDYWGIPVARLSGGSHPQNLITAKYIAGKAEAWLKEAGAFKTWERLPGGGLSGGQHQAGTCRMGDDPKTSVVNRYCQVHDVENVFVVDGSVHVTNGGFNPALTIMANAYRAADYMVRNWEKGMSIETNRPKPRRRWLVVVAVLVLAIAIPSPMFYRQYQQGRVCTSCHEIWQPYSDWHTSAHRNVPCSECHGNVFTYKAGFHLRNMKRVFAHVRGDIPDKPHLPTADVLAMTERCRVCHEQEFAAWRSSRHSATYADIFLNAKQNGRQLLMDDCLRCHGMHFQGPIRDVVMPVSRTGPWKLRDAELAQQPTVPCLTCHRMHREGPMMPLSKQDASVAGPEQEIVRPSVGLYDRRSSLHVSVTELPLPRMLEGERTVNISPDQRQALCYQCHAPGPERQVNSGDDRTSVGVHEGLSCFACHGAHGENTRASCATCHPRLSNCGIAVEKMDTTFKDRSSKHNVHFVKCTDCHTKGVPKRARAAPFHIAASTTAALPAQAGR